MKLSRILSVVVLAMIGSCAIPALADTYTLSAACIDPTPPQGGYTPVYNFEHRVNGGASTAVNNQATCAMTAGVTATAGQSIEVRAQAYNTQGPIPGAWSNWVAATAPFAPVTPGQITTLTVTVVHQ